MTTSWMAIYGNAEISGNNISLTLPPPEQTNVFIPAITQNYTLIRSNKEFEQGTIELKTLISDQNNSCLIVLNGQQGEILCCGLNTQGAPYGFSLVKNNTWILLAGSGQGSSLKKEHWHNLKIKAQGSNIDLIINDVKVLSTSYQITRGPVSLHLQGTGKISAKDIEIKNQPPICFVVMQFTSEFDELYTEVIKPNCEKFGYLVIRGDDFYNGGLILDDITRSIKDAAVVIADITPNNANVFYEVGFSHGIGKPTILLSDRKRERLPFDISGFRTLFYDNTIAGKRAVQEKLEKHLESINS